MSRAEKLVGSWGESLAARYVTERRGMEILCRNWYTNHGEIDIVARDGNCTVFIEVKTRQGNLYGTGTEAITGKKKAALLRAAEAYAVKHDLYDTPMRFDVVEITRDGEQTRLKYFENAEIGW